MRGNFSNRTGRKEIRRAYSLRSQRKKLLNSGKREMKMRLTNSYWSKNMEITGNLRENLSKAHLTF